jgi:predicted protein tyrosine phosphatase
MPVVHVCSLSRLPHVVAECGASHLVSLVSEGTPIERPGSIPADRHLLLSMHDIAEPVMGMTPPSERHVRDFIDFAERWERHQPMVIHCWAGISRSTAGAFIASCALAPDKDEEEIALDLRMASPTATPNARLVAMADNLLARNGRMQAAAKRIGRGAFAYEGAPFFLEIGPRTT